MKPETREMLLGLSGIYEQRAPNAAAESADKAQDTTRASESRGDAGS